MRDARPAGVQAADERVKASACLDARHVRSPQLSNHLYSITPATSTKRARPAEVWSWLVQIGQGRGGYYSYDRLENLMGLKVKNADAITPEWQHIHAGDIIPAEPGGKGFKVLEVKPKRVLVIGSVEANDEGVFEGFKQMFPAFTWAFVLAEVASEHTRLICRLRGQAQPSQTTAARITGFFFEPIEFLMTRKMLLGIKQRAEQSSSPAAGKASANST